MPLALGNVRCLCPACDNRRHIDEKRAARARRLESRSGSMGCPIRGAERLEAFDR